MNRLTWAVLLFGMGLAGARADDWVLDSGSLRFSGTQQEEPFTGEFKRFEPSIKFDPAHPETTRIDVTIDLASADSAQEERDSALLTPEWFDVAKFPQANFAASAATAKADGSFDAKAKLSLRGVSRDMAFPFTWTREGDRAHLRAQVTLDRLAFGLGSGEWADAEWVGHSVVVDVDVWLKPAAPKSP